MDFESDGLQFVEYCEDFDGKRSNPSWGRGFGDWCFWTVYDVLVIWVSAEINYSFVIATWIKHNFIQEMNIYFVNAGLQEMNIYFVNFLR